MHLYNEIRMWNPAQLQFFSFQFALSFSASLVKSLLERASLMLRTTCLCRRFFSSEVYLAAMSVTILNVQLLSSFFLYWPFETLHFLRRGDFRQVGSVHVLLIFVYNQSENFLLQNIFRNARHVQMESSYALFLRSMRSKENNITFSNKLQSLMFARMFYLFVI